MFTNSQAGPLERMNAFQYIIYQIVSSGETCIEKLKENFIVTFNDLVPRGTYIEKLWRV